jgi:hypothetical protein
MSEEEARRATAIAAYRKRLVAHTEVDSKVRTASCHRSRPRIATVCILSSAMAWHRGSGQLRIAFESSPFDCLCLHTRHV